MTTKYLNASANASAAVWLQDGSSITLAAASSQYGAVPDAAVLRPGDGSWSVSLWLKAANANQLGCVLSKRTAGGNNPQYSIYITNDVNISGSGKKIQCSYNGDTLGDYRWAATNSDVVDGNWHHIVMVADKPGNVVRIYVDGSAAATTTSNLGSWPALTNTADLRFGAHSAGAYLDGSVKGVRIYASALTSGNVSTLYNSGAGVYNDPIGGAVGWWKMDEGTGTSVADSSGNGNNGTLYNSPSWTSSTVDRPSTTEPGSSDTADLNSKTLTVDQTFPASGSTTIIGAGTLAVSGNRTVNANLGNSSSTFACTLNGSSQTVTINGNVLAATGSNRLTISGATTTVNLTGNATGGSASGIRGIAITNGILNLTGDVTGGSAATAEGIRVTGGTVAVVGSVSGGSNSTAYGINVVSGSPSVSITGNATAATAIAMLLASGTITHNGNAVGASAPGTMCSGATVTHTGNITGGSTNSVDGSGLSITSGTYTQTGTLTGGSGTGSAPQSSPFGAKVAGGTYNLTGSMVDGAGCSALCKIAGTFNYTPASSDTLQTGGKTMYSTQGGAIRRNFGGQFGRAA